MQDRRECADYEYHPVSADVDVLLNRREVFVEADLLDEESVTDENPTDANA